VENGLPEKLAGLEELLGYSFRDKELLLRALTHSSYANERPGEGLPDNERLEFLGDAVLGLVISDAVFRSSSDDEGGLTRYKSHLVSALTIRRLAARYELGRFLRLGRGEEQNGGRAKPSLTVNAFEAVLGAVYLDGGLEAAASLVRKTYEQVLLEFDREQLLRQDYKSYLQERIQAYNLPPPSYAVIEESGPDHAKQFTVELVHQGRSLAMGKGRSKKAAEQAAARAALDLIERGGLDLADPQGQ
jgi:ribonuclease-3